MGRREGLADPVLSARHGWVVSGPPGLVLKGPHSPARDAVPGFGPGEHLHPAWLRPTRGWMTRHPPSLAAPGGGGLAGRMCSMGRPIRGCARGLACPGLMNPVLLGPHGLGRLPLRAGQASTALTGLGPRAHTIHLNRAGPRLPRNLRRSWDSLPQRTPRWGGGHARRAAAGGGRARAMKRLRDDQRRDAKTQRRRAWIGVPSSWRLCVFAFLAKCTSCWGGWPPWRAHGPCRGHGRFSFILASDWLVP